MATKTAFPPEVMAALQKQTRFAIQSKKAVDPFASFAGPPDRYFARLQRMSVSFDKGTGDPKFNFFHTCLATIPSSSSASIVPDTKWAGQPMRISQGTKPSDNATKAEQWDRVMCLLQAYDIKTKNLGVRDGVEVNDNGVTFWADMKDAVDLLNERRPAVGIEVTETEGKGKNAGKKFKNCNVRERIDDEIVAKFGVASYEVSDEEMELPDDDDEPGASAAADETSAPLKKMDEAEATSTLSSLSREQIIEALTQESINAGRQLDQLLVSDLMLVAKAFLMQETIPQFPHGHPAYSSPEDLVARKEVVGPAGKDMRPTVVVGGDGAEVVLDAKTGLPIDDEEEGPDNDDEEETTLSQEDKLLKLQLLVGTLDRTKLKLSIRNAGGLKPTDKFKSEQTDDFLRNWLIDLKTGKTPPVHAVVPDDVPF